MCFGKRATRSTWIHSTQRLTTSNGLVDRTAVSQDSTNLRSNRPLYFTRNYELTYDDDDMPTHYSFITAVNNVEKLRSELESLRESNWRGPPDQNVHETSLARSSVRVKDAVARRIVDALDERGAWVEQGSLRYHPEDATEQIIDCHTFIKNVDRLSRFIAQRRRQ